MVFLFLFTCVIFGQQAIGECTDAQKSGHSFVQILFYASFNIKYNAPGRNYEV
jgi:hypothetical protein